MYKAVTEEDIPCRDAIYQSPEEASWQINSGSGFIHICRLDVKGARSIMYVIRLMVSSGSCGRVLRGEICRLFMETGTPYTNVLPDGNRQVCLNPYSKSFPKMPTCRMWVLTVPAVKRTGTAQVQKKGVWYTVRRTYRNDAWRQEYKDTCNRRRSG